MKKYVKLFLGICLLCLCIAGCGKKTEEPAAGSAQTESSKDDSKKKEKKDEKKDEKKKEKTDKKTKKENEYKGNVPDIEYRLAEPLYEKEDEVVYGFNLLDFGAVPDSDEDISGKLQAACILLNREGGGTIYIPAGRYRLDKQVNIPKGIVICGDYKEPKEGDMEAGGTILCIYAGRGKEVGTAQFILQPNSCVRDLTIYYPEQKVDDIQPYPATFQLYDPSVWGADYTHVRNVCLLNSYRGIIQGPNGNSSPNAYNIKGTPLSVGLSMDGTVDVGRYDNIHFSKDYWVNSGLFEGQDEEKLAKYLYENATGITLGRVDWSYFTNTVVEGYHEGIVLRSGEMGETGNYPNGQVYGHTYKNCDIAIHVKGVSGFAEEFAKINVEDCRVGLMIDNNKDCRDGELQFYDMTINANEYAIWHEGAEDVLLLDSKIEGGDVYVTSASVLNKASGKEIKDIPDTSSPSHKVERKVLYVFDGEISDETDMTAGLQKLIDKAGEEGGGIVFLPPGEYCIKGSISVPSGVELKGAVDVGRNPIRIGTILRVREGVAADGATVTLAENSGITGVVFDYPTNDFKAPKPYPYAIRGNGSDIFIVNVSLRGAYNGVDLATNRCDRHYVEYLSGICLNNAIKVGGGSDSGMIRNYQMNYIVISAGDESKFGTWDNAPTGDTKSSDSEKVAKYLQENLVVLQVGDVTNEMLFNNFSYNGYRGVLFTEENGRAADGWCIGHGVDYSSVAFEIKAVEDMPVINSQLVSFKNNGTQVDEISHIIVDSGEYAGKGEAQFINMTCWAKPNDYNVHVKSGDVFMGNMHVNNCPRISILSAAGDVLVKNSSYNDYEQCCFGVTQKDSMEFDGVLYGGQLINVSDAVFNDAKNRKVK